MYRRGEGKKFLWPFFLKKCLFIVCFIALLTAIVVMPASATTVTISPDKDVYISQSSPDGNFDEDSDYDYLFVKSRADKNQRALIHFDLSSIPSGATIDSATLHLYKYAQYPTSSPESRTNNIHRITASWTGAGVTWNNRDTGIPWTTPGGDFVSTPTASTSTGTTVGVWLEWDVKTDVQAFVDGTYPNYGWLIKDANEDAGSLKIIRYRSRENVTYHPKLEVTYTTAPAGICGDVNKDKSVDFIDVGLVGRHKLYGDPLDDEWAADVNSDDSIDFIDAGLIGRHKLYGDALNCK